MELIVAEASAAPDRGPLVPWWSFTKTILAAAALSLVERGKFCLDAPIAAAPYTLRHLLQHTSGLPDYGPLAEYHRAVAAGESPWPVEVLLRRVNATQLVSTPGTRFLYSNVGYLLVRQMIERATDRPLDDALKTLVFDPLGIQAAFVARTPEDFDAAPWGNAQRYDPQWVYHGCVVGSPANAATCLHRLLHGDLLAPATLAAMSTPFPYDDDVPPDLGYGLGLMIEPAEPGGGMAGHAGGGPLSTIAVFSTRRTHRTFAVAAGADATGTGPSLIDDVRARVTAS